MDRRERQIVAWLRARVARARDSVDEELQGLPERAHQLNAVRSLESAARRERFAYTLEDVATGIEHGEHRNTETPRSRR